MSAPSRTRPPAQDGGWWEADVRRLAVRALAVRLSIAGGLAGGMLVSLLAYGAALVGQQPEDHPPSHGEFSLAAVLPLLESIAIIATLTTGALTACVLFVGLRARERVSAARHTFVASLLAGALQIPLETPSPRSIALARGIGRAALLVACLLAELLAWAAPTSSVWLATQTVLVVALLAADVLSDSLQPLRAVRAHRPS